MRYPEGYKCPSEASDQAGCSLRCPLHNWPVGIPINNNKVVNSHVVKVVSTHTLEWIVRVYQWRRGCTGLRWGHAVAVVAAGSGGHNVRGDAGPEDG